MVKLNFLKAKVSIIVYVIVFVLILVAGILNFAFNRPSKFSDNQDLAITACTNICNLSIAKGISLVEGPCLSQEIVKGWACDVVNVPKISIIDNNPNNQCESYVKKKVRHFVEVTQSCELVLAK